LLLHIQTTPSGSKNTIKTASGTTLSIAGHGVAKLGSNKELKQVLYMPRMCKNLLLVGKLTDQGHFVVYGPRKYWILDKSDSKQVLFKGKRNSSTSMYRLKTSLSGRNLQEQDLANLSQLSSSDLAHLWHNRMGPLNFQSLYKYYHIGIW
jgi:hypothetical protein